MSSAVGGRLRPALAAALLSAVLALAGCGGDTSDEADGPAAGHDHSDAPAAVEGPEDRFAGLDLAEP